jgi:Tfp pilus assembly protein PilX
MIWKSLAIIKRLEAAVPSDRRGNALIVTLLITLALSGLVLGALMSTTTEMRLSSNQSIEQKAFYLTERGMEESIAFLAQMGTPLTGAGGGGGPVALFVDKAAGEGTYSAWADPMDSNTGQSTRFVAVTVRGTLNGTGVSRAVQVRLGQQNFSRYSYFTDLELSPGGTTIWFTTSDEFFGPVHTNDQMHISGDPIFHEEVSSSAADIQYYAGGPPTDNPVFEKGVQLNVPPIELPLDTSLLEAKSQEAGGLHFTGNPVEIEMFVDAADEGALRVRVNGGAWTVYDVPANGVCYVEGKAELKGTLKGQMTLGCDGDIEIMDNCIYDTDPRTDPTSTDILGMVSDGDVYLDGNPYGPNCDTADETVMATIMALDTSFTVENYSSGSPRGALVIYGGLIQACRGPVGTFNPTTHQVVSGYSKAYTYDPRLMDNPPPAFPTTGEVEKISWQELDPSIDITANTW